MILKTLFFCIKFYQINLTNVNRIQPARLQSQQCRYVMKKEEEIIIRGGLHPGSVHRDVGGWRHNRG